MSILGSFVSGLFGLGQAAMNNAWAAEQASRDRQQNYMYGEMAANNADKRTRALYMDLQSPQALMQQYQEAGLSPSLMFGGTPGQGGVKASSQGTGAAGPQTPFMPMSIVDAAQAAALFAQAEKTKEETKTEKGTNAKGQATLKQLLADANLKEAEAGIAKAQEGITKIQEYIAGETKEYSIMGAQYQAQQIMWGAEQAMWDAKKSKQDYEFDKETFESRVEQIKEQTCNIAADTFLKGCQAQLTAAQIEHVKASIQTMYQELALKAQELAQMKTSIDNQKEFWDNSIDQAKAKLAQDLELGNKAIKQQYVKMGVNAVTSIVGGALGGAVVKNVLGAGKAILGGNNTYGGEVIFE